MHCRTSSTQMANLNPNVIGSAWTPWVRPAMRVSLCSIARRVIASLERCEVFEQDIRSIAKSQRQCRIDDVIRGQADVDIAGVLADRFSNRG